MYKKIFLIGFLLLLLGAANAARLTGDFSLETNCVVPDKATYLLHNNSGRTQTYTVSATGENSDWINLNGQWIGEDPLVVTLREDESEELYAFVKPQTCYVTPGQYTVTIEVSNGETISREIDVEVLESRVLELEIVPRSQETTQCEEKEFQIRVRNIGERSEKVSLEIEGLRTSWTRLSVSEMDLDKGETRTADLAVKPSCTAETRDYPFTVKASLLGTSFFTVKEAILEIEDRQKIRITEQDFVACSEKITGTTIRVKNTGLLEDSIDLSIERLDWAAVEPSSLTLQPGQEKEVQIVFLKTSAAKGEYDFSLRAYSARFKKESVKEMSVELQDCYNLVIDKVSINDKEAEEKPTACVESSPVYTFTLRNDAVREVEADIRISGIATTVSPGKVKIEPGETADVRVELNLENAQAGEKVFTLIVTGENILMQHEYELVAEDCFGLEVDWDGLIEPIVLDANCKSEPFTIIVKNNGTRDQAARVSVSGQDWIYFEPESALIEAGKEQEIYFYFAPPYDIKEGKHSAIVSVTDSERSYNRRIEMTVYGGLYADLGTASVQTKAKVGELVENLEKTLIISLQLSNDSNFLIRVDSITAKDFEADFDFKETVLNPAETIEVPAILYLGDSNETQFGVTLLIETDKGTLEREIPIDLEEEPEEQLVLPVGLFGLADLGDIALAGIVIVVIVVFAAIALRSEAGGRKKESGLTHLAKEVEELPGKKLEEIGKRKRRASSKNLQDIVKEVKKKHVKKTSKKKTAKKPAKKKPARKGKR